MDRSFVKAYEGIKAVDDVDYLLGDVGINPGRDRGTGSLPLRGYESPTSVCRAPGT